jgi:adenosylcobinamide-phosphate synthase
LEGRLGGAILAVLTVTLAAGAAFGMSFLAHASSLALGVIADAALIWMTLSVRSLARAGHEVARNLEEGDLSAARLNVARIVARRTDQLDETGISRAAVESLGENVVDGVIAPLFWAVLLGPAGAWVHKAASTLDSMVGYRDERHAQFGWASARLDDVLAWLPARAALAVVSAAAAAIRLDAHDAWRIGWRDRLKHASPNSAHGEAAFAGALGVSLGGPVEYADRIQDRPVIGAGLRPPGSGRVWQAALLVLATGCTATASGIAILAAASIL